MEREATQSPQDSQSLNSSDLTPPSPFPNNHVAIYSGAHKIGKGGLLHLSGVLETEYELTLIAQHLSETNKLGSDVDRTHSVAVAFASLLPPILKTYHWNGHS